MAMKYAQNISLKYRFKVRKKVLKLKSMENRFFFKCYTTLQHNLNIIILHADVV